MAIKIEDIIKVVLFASEILACSKFVYHVVVSLKNILNSEKSNDTGLPKLASFNADFFTSKKYDYLGVLCIGLPIITIVTIVITTENLGKYDILMLILSPLIILFYLTFNYFSRLILTTVEINTIIFAKLLSKLANKPITIKTSKGEQTYQ
jgi:hypothetical protein